MDWGYMNGILRRWHEKGLHTAAAVAGVLAQGTGGLFVQGILRQAHGPQKDGPLPLEPSAQQERRAREDMERMRRLMEQMRQEGS